MPDLSGRQLKVKRLPYWLNAWEAGGFKAGTFEPPSLSDWTTSGSEVSD